MVNTCDFCSQELHRHIFCSSSCKVRYHRGDKPKTVIPEAINTVKEIKEKLTPKVEVEKKELKFSKMLNKWI